MSKPPFEQTCLHDEKCGILITNPPQLFCKRCGQTWVYGQDPPICRRPESPIVLAIVARARQSGKTHAIAHRLGIVNVKNCPICGLEIEEL